MGAPLPALRHASAVAREYAQPPRQFHRGSWHGARFEHQQLRGAPVLEGVEAQFETPRVKPAGALHQRILLRLIELAQETERHMQVGRRDSLDADRSQMGPELGGQALRGLGVGPECEEQPPHTP
jgi:hypothetical protein